MGLKLEDLPEGTVYLVDKRNGQLYYYEPTLAQMGYIKRQVRGQEDEKEPLPETYTGAKPYASHLTPQERAERWDELARMNADKRKREEEAAAARGEELPYKPEGSDEATEEGQQVPADQTHAEAGASEGATAGQGDAGTVNAQPKEPVRVMTDKAKGASYEDFQSKGWTDEQLLHNGYMIYE